MSMETFEVEMKKILEFQGADPATLGPDFDLSSIDSLSRAEMIVAAEMELEITISNQGMVDCKTYGDFIKLCERSGYDRVPDTSTP